MKKEKHLKQIIYKSIENILKRENKKNLTLNEIDMEVANYLKKDILFLLFQDKSLSYLVIYSLNRFYNI